MPANQDGADVRRLAIAVLLHERADRYGLLRHAVPDAADRFASEGGELSTGPAGAYLPSGASLDSWLNDQREGAAHLFALPTAAEPVPVIAKSKVKVAKDATASEKLAAANGDAPARL